MSGAFRPSNIFNASLSHITEDPAGVNVASRCLEGLRAVVSWGIIVVFKSPVPFFF